jgi:hypothetical protein
VRIFSVNYTVQSGPFKDVSFRFDKGILNSNVPGVRDMTETRLTTEYTIKFF